MTLAQARALLGPALVWCLPYEPEEDLRRLRGLADWALRYTPIVAVDAPDGLLLDIAGCEHLFGGEARLLEDMAAALAERGWLARLAAASTYGCAWALARYGESPDGDRSSIRTVPDGALREALGALPVEALRIDRPLVEALHEIGIERIAHLFALPRRELAVRFGPLLLQRLDRAAGALPERVQTHQPPRRWEVQREFDGPVTRLEVVEVAVLELLGALLASLGAEARGIRHLEIVLRRERQAPAALRIALTHASRDAAHIAGLLRPKLERLHLGWGVEEVRLAAVRTGRCRDEQEWLWEALRETDVSQERDRTALGEWLDRMRERVGAASICRTQACESHAPERVFALRAVHDIDALAPPRRALRPAELCRADRPSRLLTPPEPARVMSLVPDGPPVWLDWDRLAGRVTTAHGPERIALPWWTGEQTMHIRTRDYYQVQDEHGRWLWLFRSVELQGWYVHGVWA